MIKDDFHTVCSWTQFPAKNAWKYDLLLGVLLREEGLRCFHNYFELEKPIASEKTLLESIVCYFFFNQLKISLDNSQGTRTYTLSCSWHVPFPADW